jgi:hypothetical protein
MGTKAQLWQIKRKMEMKSRLKRWKREAKETEVGLVSSLLWEVSHLLAVELGRGSRA